MNKFDPIKATTTLTVCLFTVIALVACVGCDSSADDYNCDDDTTLAETNIVVALENLRGEDAVVKSLFNGLLSQWDEDDEIAIFGEGKQTFTYASRGAKKTEASFKGHLPAGDALSAIYPASLATAYDQITLPHTQTYVENGIANGAMPMSAIISNYTDKIAMANLCGVATIKLTGTATVKQITLSSRNDSYPNISGVATILNDKVAPSLSVADSNSSKSVTLDCGNGVTLSSTPTSFNIVVPAINKIKIEIETSSDGTMVYYRDDISLLRNENETILSSEFDNDVFFYHQGLRWANQNATGGSDPTNASYIYDGNGSLFTAIDAQTACGDGWRLPTSEDYESLASSGVENNVKVNGVVGSLFGKALFLPWYGHSKGYYWTSTLNPKVTLPGDPTGAQGAYSSMFLNDEYSLYYKLAQAHHKGFNFNVRCVQDVR